MTEHQISLHELVEEKLYDPEDLPDYRRNLPSRDFYLPGDRGDPPRRLGKIQPRRFSSLSAVKAVPGMVAGFWTERVPDQFWGEDSDSAGRLAIVACPCGEEAVIPLLHFGDCSCGRWYWFLGDRVLLGNEIEEPEGAESGRGARVD